jgi:hypothetical protein
VKNIKVVHLLRNGKVPDGWVAFMGRIKIRQCHVTPEIGGYALVPPWLAYFFGQGSRFRSSRINSSIEKQADSLSRFYISTPPSTLVANITVYLPPTFGNLVMQVLFYVGLCNMQNCLQRIVQSSNPTSEQSS